MFAVGVVTFFILITLLGIYVSKRVTNAADYYVAGRNASTVLIVGSLVASVVSSVGFTGEVGFAYDGYPILLAIFIMIMCSGYVLGTIMFGKYLRRSEALTLPEFFGNRFQSKKVQVAASITVIVGITAYLVSVAQAGTIILADILGINYVLALIIMWLVYTTFTFLSGAKGVLVTDTFMFFLFFIASVISVPVILMATGGWPDAFINSVAQPGREGVFNWHGITGEGAYMGTKSEVLIWVITMAISWAFVTAISPWQTSRYLMAKNEHVILRAGMLAPIPMLIIYLFLHSTMATLPLIKPEITNSDSAYIWAAQNILPMWMGVIVVSGIMAAVLSSCSTFLQLIGNTIARDIIPNKNLSDKKVLNLAKASMLIASVIVLIIGLKPPTSVMWLAYSAATMFAASWGPMALASIYSKKVTKTAAFWSILLGLFGVLVGEALKLFGLTLPLFLPPVIIGTILSITSLVLISKFTNVTEEERLEREKLFVIPESMYDSKELAITKRYPLFMIISGVGLIAITFVYYYLPVHLM